MPELPEAWDSYLGLVDDAPASILLNLALEAHAPVEGLGVLHYWSADMLDAGPSGMGTGEEAEAFAEIEDAVTAAAAEIGLLQVGRLRNHGYFQFHYYGPSDLSEQLGAIAHRILDEGRRDSLQIGSKEDPQWEYFLGFLCPTPEQRRWMNDRNVVMQFMQHGDPLTPRPIDHFAYFPDQASATAFAKACADAGFEAGVGEPHEDNPNWSVQAVREDSIDLNHIHGVVLDLTEMAETCGGSYDGWGAPLVQPS